MKGIWTPIHRCLHSLSSSRTRANFYFEWSNEKQLSDILITTVNAWAWLRKGTPNGLTKKQSPAMILLHVHTVHPECTETRSLRLKLKLYWSSSVSSDLGTPLCRPMSTMIETVKKPPQWYAKQAAMTRQGVLIQHTEAQKARSQCVMFTCRNCCQNTL